MDENFLKYPKIFQVGHDENKDIFKSPDDEIVIQEKVDGANFRFIIKDGEIVFGSRGTQGIKEEGQWKRCMAFIKENINKEIFESENKYCENYIFYGECMIKHTIDYDWGKVPPFLGFDIYSIKDQKFVDWLDVYRLYEIIHLPVVPHIKICKSNELLKWDDNIVPQSQYYDGQAEGLVFKNYDKQLMAKWVVTKFKEDNKKVFGSSKRQAKNDNEMLIAIYCTNRRIDKCILALVNEGHKLDMPLMHHLPKKVYSDIMEEHWREVCFSHWSVNFKDILKLISQRCLAVLKNAIANNAIQALKGEVKE